MSEATQSQRPWHKSKLGIILAICIWPFFLTWLIYTKSNWNSKVKYGAIAGIWALVAVSYINTNQSIVAPVNENKPTAAATVTKSTPTPAPTTTKQTVIKNEPAEKLALTEAKVLKVVDGDTVDVTINGETERLRLIGIDTPEVVDPRKPVQCFGVEASNKAKELLNGKTIKLEADPSQGERDKYNRLLRYIYLPDGQLFNKRMLTEGYAFEYTYNIPYKYQAAFQKAEADARSNSRGLWALSACNGEQKSAVTPTPAPTHKPIANPTTTTAPPISSNCDPNYTGGCVPNVSYDLDCSDISFSVTVIGYDKHHFDGNGDGHGCESN